MTSLATNNQLNAQSVPVPASMKKPNAQPALPVEPAKTETSKSGVNVSLSKDAQQIAAQPASVKPTAADNNVHKGIAAYQQVESFGVTKTSEVDKAGNVSSVTAIDAVSYSATEEEGMLLDQEFAKGLDSILSEDSYLNAIGMSKEDKQKLQDLNKKIEDIYKDGNVSAEEEKNLLAIEKDMDSVFVKYEDNIRENLATLEMDYVNSLPLTDDEKAQFAEINKQLEALYGKPTLTPEDNDKLMELELQQEAIIEKYAQA